MERIYLSSPTIHGEEKDFVKEAFDTNWVAPLGKNVDEFEKEISKYLGVGYGAATVSGTSALFLAYKLAGIKPGDKVFCSDFTFAATVNPISYLNAFQIFIDSERDTWNMCPKCLEKAFEKHPDCKFVALVHLYGVPAKVKEIKDICDRHGAILIEDAAESLSSTYNGIQTGSFGKYAAVSFNGNKIITSSGGGMLISNDEEGIKKARFLSTQAREPFAWYEHNEIGYNFRMSNIVAGIGRGQLLHLDEHRQRKIEIYQKYEHGLENLPVSMNPYQSIAKPNFWLSCMLIDEGVNVSPLDIMKELNKHNIESRPLWKPMHLQPVYQDREFIKLNKQAVDEDLFNRGLCLPSDIKMTESQQEKIIDIIKSFFN